MNRKGIRRAITAWVACLALLLSALAPAFSQVLAASARGVEQARLVAGASIAQADTCHSGPAIDGEAAGRASMNPPVHDTQTPTAHTSAGDSHSPQDPSAGFHAEHCPFCSTPALGLPPVSGALALPAMAPASGAPSLFYSASRTLFAWVSSQPRAPPFIS